MKGRVDKSVGIVTLIDEDLAKINPTEPFRFAKRKAYGRTVMIFFGSIFFIILFFFLPANWGGGRIPSFANSSPSINSTGATTPPFVWAQQV